MNQERNTVSYISWLSRDIRLSIDQMAYPAPKIKPWEQAEALRKDRETQFAKLCRDLTNILDRMAHPLTTRPLQLIKEIKFGICGIPGGRNFMAKIKENGIKDRKFGHYSLPDCTLLRIQTVSETANLIDLQGADDDSLVYCDGQILHINQDQYRFREGSSGIFCYNLAEIDQAPAGINLFFYSDQITRGVQGWIYFFKRKDDRYVYRLNIQTPTQLECLTIPLIDTRILRIQAALKANILILKETSRYYRWDLGTQQITMIYFPINPWDCHTYLDPLTGTMYYLHKYQSLIREDGQVILTVESKTKLMNVRITLEGQILVDTMCGRGTTSWLYG